MQRKIILYMLPLFVVFAAGAIIAWFYMQTTLSEINRLIRLHEIENLRKDLIISLQEVQSDLYTVYTPAGQKLDTIVTHAANLESSAKTCMSCHHEASVDGLLHEMQTKIMAYQRAMSFYITASANSERIENLRHSAAIKGNDLLLMTGDMSARASRKLALVTGAAFGRINKAKIIIVITTLLSGILGILIAVRLSISILKPIKKLEEAARAVTKGQLGYTVSFRDRTEFGNIAEAFNEMSVSLEKGYRDLHNEVVERSKIEQELRDSNERYALAARGANDGLWDWDLRKNSVFYSNRWKAMLGYDDGDIRSHPDAWLDLVHPEDRQQLKARISGHLDGHTPQFGCEYRIRHKDGRYLWVFNRGLAVYDHVGNPLRFAGSQTDITERKQAEEQLLHDAFHDALTGLPNRALFMDRLDQRLKRIIKRKKETAKYLSAVLFLDLDRFKVVNDSMGHSTGDQLLIHLAERLTVSVRPGDTVARLGGDEFAVLIEDIENRAQVDTITTRIQNMIERPFHINGQEIYTSSSIGIAFCSSGYEQTEDVIRDAEMAMYQAKSRGKSNCEIFDEKLYSSRMGRLQLENDLRKALEHDELILHYQPIIELNTEQVIGFEALIRWNHPKHGIIYPVDFIPIAEETGLILAMSEWILDEACRQINVWQKKYATNMLNMSVNISAKQFLDVDFEAKVKRALHSHCLDACCLTLEITESVIMADDEHAAAMIRKLRDIGIHIHIDDFGTGYSSLSYLNRFAVNALKIDRSFVMKMLSDNENREIVKTIASLAHTLNLDIVAEGVEGADQLKEIRDMNCQYGQGYMFYRPLTVEQAESLLESLQTSFIS
jgi:diguanylate cyclase (GGDEF)-like protein/PAS domain S-box-containing protein